jgi:hypothetical protein
MVVEVEEKGDSDGGELEAEGGHPRPALRGVGLGGGLGPPKSWAPHQLYV